MGERSRSNNPGWDDRGWDLVNMDLISAGVSLQDFYFPVQKQKKEKVGV